MRAVVWLVNQHASLTHNRPVVYLISVFVSSSLFLFLSLFDFPLLSLLLGHTGYHDGDGESSKGVPEEVT